MCANVQSVHFLLELVYCKLYLTCHIVRFETQEDTGKHLQELQNRAEKEIRDLGAVKEKLEAEWELVKFMGQEENTELREKLELLDEDIQDQQVERENLNKPMIYQYSLIFSDPKEKCR